MKTLFESISELNIENDFSIQFQIIGISKGWKLIDKLECEDVTKRNLVKFCAYAYSIESPLLRKKKDRWAVKESILSFLRIDPDTFILNCINNKNSDYCKYITFWLKESQTRDFGLLVSVEESMYQLLELARNGIETININEDSVKKTSEALKYFQKTEVTIKADAMKRALEMKNQIESLERQLEKKYDYLMGIVREELPDAIAGLGWAEKQVLKRKEK